MIGSTILCAAVLAADPAGPARTPDGLYLRLAGSFVLQQDADLLSVGGVPLSATQDFSTGFGVQAGVGYTFAWETGPSVSLEFEYSFRTAQIEQVSAPPLSLPATGQNESHSLMFNVIGGIDIIGGLGLYAGGGFGVSITNSDLTVDLGGGSFASFPGDTDTTISWQAMGGVQWAFGAHFVLYSGVRFFDAGTVEFETFQSDNSSVSIELGLRYYF
jgi:opacity protein-like surface antigen